MKNLFVFCFFCFSICFSNFAQSQFCGTDEMHQGLFFNNSQYNAGVNNAYNRLQLHTDNYITNYSTQKSNALYIIPVVFHIIHNNGIENINDSQVHDAMAQLNKQFRKLNADTSEIFTAFQSLASDTRIEFRLAQKDPNNLCTSGITRTVSPLGNIGNHDVKSLIQWPPNKYLNVYVCINAAGLAGHAMMPPAADTMPQWDGIVMQHSYIGTIGTSTFFNRTVLSHEVGHYLNLQHIWGGNNVPNYYYLPCGAVGNCAFDDDVLDTPNTIGFNSCNLAGNSCGELSNVQNYMDYAYCARMFTAGQVMRMHAALNSSVAGRNNLWQPSNLIATGTDGNSILCNAKFEVSKKVICVGDSVFFRDVSFHQQTGRLWDFQTGTASSLSDSAVSVIFNTTGNYIIKLTAINGLDSVVTTQTIVVLPQVGNMFGILEDFESPVSFDQKWINLNEGFFQNDWEFTNVGYQSSSSFKVNNFINGNDKIYEFISKPINMLGASDLAIRFDYAYAKKLATNNDVLKIYTSADCGNTWQLKKSIFANSNLSTSLLTTNPFLPIQTSEWKSDTVKTTSASVLVSKLLVKFRFEGKGGNNFYIDNIQIGKKNQLNIETDLETQFVLFPNPAHDKVTIQSEKGMIGFKIFDLHGKEIMKNNVKATSYLIDTQLFANGIYIIKILSEEGNAVIKKLIIKQ